MFKEYLNPKDTIYDYKSLVNVPSSSTAAGKKKTRIAPVLSVITFPRVNSRAVISAIATYFVHNAIHLTNNLNLKPDPQLLKTIIDSRNDDEDLWIAAIRYRCYITPKGIINLFFIKDMKITTDQLTAAAITFFNITSNIFVNTKLKVFSTSPIPAIAYISPHSYQIVNSLNDIFERYGAYYKSLFEKHSYEMSPYIKKILDKIRKPKFDLDKANLKDAFEIDIED